MEIDRNLSLHVLDSLPTEPAPGGITPPDKEERVNAVNSLAAAPLSPPRDLMNKAKKLQSLFSDKASRVNHHRLMKRIEPEDVIRIHSASDEGAKYRHRLMQRIDQNSLCIRRRGSNHPSPPYIAQHLLSITGLQDPLIPTSRYTDSRGRSQLFALRGHSVIE